jgi:hypothetical protein
VRCVHYNMQTFTLPILFWNTTSQSLVCVCMCDWIVQVCEQNITLMYSSCMFFKPILIWTPQYKGMSFVYCKISTKTSWGPKNVKNKKIVQTKFQNSHRQPSWMFIDLNFIPCYALSYTNLHTTFSKNPSILQSPGQIQLCVV